MRTKYIDLHLHLDGAITAKAAMELAEVQGISLPAKTEKELEKLISVPEGCESLNDFLRCFELPLSLLQTREGIRRAVRLVLEEQKREGVIYAEIRFSPQLHTGKGLSQEEVLRAALEGLQDAPIPANLILACMRGADNQRENEENLELARRFLTKDGGVTAVDLAGAEALSGRVWNSDDHPCRRGRWGRQRAGRSGDGSCENRPRRAGQEESGDSGGNPFEGDYS